MTSPIATIGSSSTGTVLRGLAAAAVGTTLLNLVGYADMLLTDRSASAAPAELVGELAGRLDVDLPDGGNQWEAAGALGGLAAGLAVGVAASAARRLGVRVSAPVGAVLTGAAAMAATDVPMWALGVDDPTTWTAQDWARDAIPHLAYGAGVRWTLDRISGPAAETRLELDPARRPVTTGLLLRSALIGVASGGRTSMGVLGAALATGHTRTSVGAAGLGAGELVMDKLPSTPSRLEPGVLAGRAAAGGLGAVGLARADSAPVLLPALAGVLGAGVGSVLGAAWRDFAQDRGLTWQAAVVEDVAAVGLTLAAVGRRP